MFSITPTYQTVPCQHLNLQVYPSVEGRHLKAVAASRASLSLVFSESWLTSPGLYFLFGDDRCYVGQSDNLITRWSQHQPKEWWLYAVGFYQGSQPWSKSELLVLEHLFIEKALQLNMRLENRQRPAAPVLDNAAYELLQVQAQLIAKTLEVQGWWRCHPKASLRLSPERLVSTSSRIPSKQGGKGALVLKPPRKTKTAASLVLEGRRWEAPSWTQLAIDLLQYLIASHGLQPFRSLCTSDTTAPVLTLTADDGTICCVAWPASLSARKRLLLQWGSAVHADIMF